MTGQLHYLVLAACIFGYASAQDLLFEDSARLLEEGRAYLTGGQIFLNGTTALVLGALAAAAIIAAWIILWFALFPAQSDSGYGSYGYGYNQRNTFEPEYKRRSGLVDGFYDQLTLLAEAFKKYNTNETDCQLYVACESADTPAHEKNGKLAKVVYHIMSQITKAPETEDLYKDDPYMKDLTAAFRIGSLGGGCAKFQQSCGRKVFS